MTLRTNHVIELNLDDIFRGQGMDPEIVRNGKPSLMAAAEKARVEAASLIHPVTLAIEYPVLGQRHERILLEGNKSLTGPAVTRHLGGSRSVVAALCSIGPELEETVSQTLRDDPHFAMALDGFGNAYIEALCQEICRGIADHADKAGMTATTPLSPGVADWPVDKGQPQVFALVDAAKAGITLNPASMMLPKKSASFVVGIGMQTTQIDPCDVCNLKETCRYKHG